VSRGVPVAVTDTTAAATPIDVYWRQGCGACSSMRLALTEAGVPVRWHDIWADPEAAAYVRSVANGNETVPTVRLGDRVLVAPRPRAVVDELSLVAPESVADTRRWPPLRIVQWVLIIALLILSEVLSQTGQSGLSWAADGAAIAVYVMLRRLRARPRQPAPSPAHR
jgi:glutaredoxin